MTETDVDPGYEALQALASAGGADHPQPVENPPESPVMASPMAVLPSPAARSASQALIERFTAQTVRLQNIRSRLEKVLGVIDGRGNASEGEAGTSKPRPTSYFAGLTLLADCKDSVMDGLDKTVAELETLF